VSGMALTSSSIRWSWTQSPSPGIVNDSLDLYMGSTCASSIVEISGGGPLTTYTSTGLLGGSAYSVEVVAWNASGSSASSNCATATTPPGAPSAPSSLAVTGATLLSLTLSWMDPTPSSSFGNISLAYGVSPDSLTSVISEGKVATGTVTGLSSGRLYYFEVTAWNGSVPSLGSNEASGSTLGAAPAAPTGLRQTENSSTTIQVAWTNPGAGTFTNITIYYQLASVGSTTTASAGTASSAALTGLTPGSAYLVAVAAWNGTAHSASTAYLHVWTNNSIPAPPAAPTELRVTAVTTTTLSLAWTLPPAGFDNVSLEYHLRSAGATNTTLSLGSRASAFTIGSLAPGSSYQFAVATWNLSVGSGYRPFVNGTTASNTTGNPGGSGCGASCSSPPFELSLWALAVGVLVVIVIGLLLWFFLIGRRRGDDLPRAPAEYEGYPPPPENGT
jgi:hypothetical protein